MVSSHAHETSSDPPAVSFCQPEAFTSEVQSAKGEQARKVYGLWFMVYVLGFRV